MQTRNRQAGVPLYTQIASTLRAKVDSGQWEVGDQLASIEQLSREYGVGISTVRQAIGTLEEQGLLERVHGRGTFVRAVPRDMRWLPLGADWDSLARNIEELTPRQVLEESSGEQPRLNAGDGDPAPCYHYIRRVHERNGNPFSVVRLYLDSRLFRRAPHRFREELVMQVLKDMPDVEMAGVRQTLLVDGADREQAENLQIGFGAPVALLHRAIQDGAGTAIYVADFVYRGDVVRLDIDLPPEPNRDQQTQTDLKPLSDKEEIR
ncbi:MAG TPA: GntR family transcriptional regulator [Rhodospirillaceae bacterium]|nr:GntR family transcriptional regulator [Rhodospirillaceae bacterium]